MRFASSSEQETVEIGKKLGAVLKPGDIIAMRGDLASGKTALTRGIAEELSVQIPVTSPTFAIVHEYNGRIPLFHFDMYRLFSSDELYDIGFYDYLERGGICCIEWSENISDALPENTSTVIFTKGEKENDRIITVLGEVENRL